MAVEAGADSGIIDPIANDVGAALARDRSTRPFQLALDVLTGADRNCRAYMKAFRAGELEDGRGLTMARYRILSWRGIPAQLKVYRRERPAEVGGARRAGSCKEIDRVAMREGIIGSDEYLELWEWSERPRAAGHASTRW